VAAATSRSASTEPASTAIGEEGSTIVEAPVDTTNTLSATAGAEEALPAAAPSSAGAAVPAPANAALPQPLVVDAATHLQRLQQHVQDVGRARAPRPRDPAWQQARRQREQAVRADTVALVQQVRSAGLTTTVAADLLVVPARTLRHWRARRDSRARALGRPHARATADQATAAISFVHQHGPHVGLPTLQASFPTLARAELRDLLACYRHLWSHLHPRQQVACHWHVPGLVWAMDFTEVRRPIDGRWRYVLAVRDLASGLQLTWRPVPGPTVAALLPELQLLFTIYGAPLVVKSDNGSAFRAADLKGFLQRWQVWPLYSPPGAPWYNGAIEASIRSLKIWTEYEAWRNGHADAWASADLDAARAFANTLSRPRRLAGRAPAEVWESRRPPSQEVRDDFGVCVRHLEAEARRAQGIPLDAALDHYDQAALHRRVLESVLVEHGYLSITRRRLPQRLFGKSVAKIM
jgi:transposase InsO family protein